jgi:hypothetical protein
MRHGMERYEENTRAAQQLTSNHHFRASMHELELTPSCEGKCLAAGDPGCNGSDGRDGETARRGGSCEEELGEWREERLKGKK